MSSNDPDQLNLFGPTTADVARQTRESEDEKQWRKERSRRSKRNRGKPNPIPVTGPACGRCQYWSAPEEKGAYGHCQIRVVAMQRVISTTRIIEKGMCLGRDPRTGAFEIGPGQLVIEVGFDWEFQHCGPSWSCRGFVEAGEWRQAA